MLLTSCPPNELLEQFLLGLTDDESAIRFETHVVGCDRCRRAAANLTASDAWVAALAGMRKVDSPPLVELLVPHLKRIPHALERTTNFSAAARDADTSPWIHQPTKRAKDRGPSTDRDRLGPYEVRGELGRGGMGAVLEAFDPRLQRSVAIKVVQADLLTAADSAERFVREARAAAAVEHDHITPVYAVEMVDGAPCIVMPLLRGRTLQRRLEEAKGPLPLAELLRIGRETASGLAAAHARGLVHRDIKPANLWLEAPHGRVKILDFGLALVRGDSAYDTSEIAGTPGFFAPEQARGEAVDARTDLFSLGCVLYLAATGKAAFTGPANLRTLWTVLSDPPPAAATLNRDCPAEISALIARLLAQRPEDRPASAEEVREELEAIVRRPVELQRRQTRRRWIGALVSAAAVSALGVAVWATTTRQAILAPVEVTLNGEPADLKVILEHAGREIAADLSGTKKLSLPPGDYALRPATPADGRTLIPSRFTVLPDSHVRLQVAWVGELARHATHSQPVTAVAMAGEADRLRVFSVGLDRALVAWEAAANTEPAFVNLPFSAFGLAVHGAEVATAGGNKFPPVELTIQRRRSDDLEPRGESLVGHTRRITALAYSPEGSRLASAAADGVCLWDVTTGERSTLPDSTQHAVLAVAFSADGKRLLAAGQEGSLMLWDVATGGVLKTFVVGEFALRAVVMLPDGFAAAGDDGVIRIWNQVTFDSRSLESRQGGVLALAASADGRLLVSGGEDGTLGVWSLPSGQRIHTLEGHRRPVQAVAITANGRQAVSGGADNTVRLWQLPFP